MIASSRDMPPQFSMNHARNCWLRDVEFICQPLLADSASGVSDSDLNNIGIGQLCSMVTGSLWNAFRKYTTWVFIAARCGAVPQLVSSKIVLVVSRAEMVRVYARGVVAWPVEHQRRIVSKDSPVEMKRQSMTLKVAPFDIELPVSRLRFGCCPNPAIAGFVNFAPESNLVGFRQFRQWFCSGFHGDSWMIVSALFGPHIQTAHANFSLFQIKHQPETR